MGCNLLRHTSLSLYSLFNTHEAQHHDIIFNHRIDHISLLCVFVPCMLTHVHVYVCVYTSMYIYAQVS